MDRRMEFATPGAPDRAQSIWASRMQKEVISLYGCCDVKF